MSTPIVVAEIAEQPAVVRRLLAEGLGPVEELAARVRALRPAHLVLVARGTSDNVARYAQHVLGRFCGLPVTLATPSLLTLYGATIDLREAVVIAISQSGGSPDIRAVLEDARHQGRLTAAITNHPDSPLAEVADIVIALGAGEERAIAATKTYTSSLAAVAALTAALSPGGGRAAELAEVAGAMAAQLERPVSAAFAAGWERVAMIGRGPHLATAFEAALKVKELTGVAAEPYSPTDLLHGPIATVGPANPLLAVTTAGPALSSTLEAVRAAEERGAPVVVLSDRDDHGPWEAIRVETLPDWLSPLVAILPAQQLAVALAGDRGVDVDRPFGLLKVTKTT